MLSELVQYFAIFIQFLRKLLTIPDKEKRVREDNKIKVAVKENGIHKINFSLLSEIIFTNDAAFNNIDTVTAKMLKCVCKNAGLNKTIKLKLDVYKARYYYEKLDKIINKRNVINITRNITRNINRNIIGNINKNKNRDIEDFITKFKEVAKENAVVNDGFRELVVIDYKLALYNYSELKYYTETYDIDKENLLGKCVQYLKVIQCLGFYDYYKGYDSNYDNYYVRIPLHFIKAPENIYEYEYVPDDNYVLDDQYENCVLSVSHEFVFTPFI